MSISKLLIAYVMLCQYGIDVWRSLMARIGPITTVYVRDDDTALPTFRNISLYYYLGLIPVRYHEGSYFVRIRDVDGTHTVGFRGKIDDVRSLKLAPKEPIKRRNFVFNAGDETVDVDLQVLDDYWRHTKRFGSTGLTKLADIVTMLGIKADSISIFKPLTFEKTRLPVSNADIRDLYTESR